ncbi:DUF2975 domain-containing protein [Paenibacillus sp. CAA11]|uniref:DUF2975 domain-containing protein n=1 Tax=Paenibacillus sp. CAA11 TaxID=1532905 RepID=UPI000D388ED0|nr:DUF2975 domain-containing protein [Paenibacillus sp. CAA11]AWB44692.1 DUF2975 domain-containing protein [Paenibacillus sp. CAA11]
MERITTLFLRVTVVLIGIVILALCIFVLPLIANKLADHYPLSWRSSVIIGMYAAVIPFFIALFQALKLLSYIDKNKAFSDLSVRALKNIKYCAIAISILYVAIAPFLYLMAQKDDAPGMVAFGCVIIFASLVIAVFAAVLQKLLENAIDIKSENDLTV